MMHQKVSHPEKNIMSLGSATIFTSVLSIFYRALCELSEKFGHFYPAEI
jgi:hypothetical protein